MAAVSSMCATMIQLSELTDQSPCLELLFFEGFHICCTYGKGDHDQRSNPPHPQALLRPSHPPQLTTAEEPEP